MAPGTKRGSLLQELTRINGSWTDGDWVFSAPMRQVTIRQALAAGCSRPEADRQWCMGRKRNTRGRNHPTDGLEGGPSSSNDDLETREPSVWPGHSLESFRIPLACAFVRGRLAQASSPGPPIDLFTKPLEALTSSEQHRLIRMGIDQGLLLHQFKWTAELPRVRHVLGVLKSLQPRSLLDVGSGRGAFLWPLVETFPSLPVTVIELLPQRVEDIQAVRDGGFPQIRAYEMDACRMAFADRSFDVVTALEVVEHVREPQRAISEICRMAARSAILSVPSRPDDNPEHIHLFSEKRLAGLLQEGGAARVTFAYVPNHLIGIARVG